MPEGAFGALAPQTAPEMQRCGLAAVVLQLKALPAGETKLLTFKEGLGGSMSLRFRFFHFLRTARPSPFLSPSAGPGTFQVITFRNEERRRAMRRGRPPAGGHHVGQRAHPVVELAAHLVAQVVAVVRPRRLHEVARAVGRQRVLAGRRVAREPGDTEANHVRRQRHERRRLDHAHAALQKQLDVALLEPGGERRVDQVDSLRAVRQRRLHLVERHC